MGKGSPCVAPAASLTGETAGPAGRDAEEGAGELRDGSSPAGG